jgi:hypothetical protein
MRASAALVACSEDVRAYSQRFRTQPSKQKDLVRHLQLDNPEGALYQTRRPHCAFHARLEATMPVLSFPCAVTNRDGATPAGCLPTWIKGHDLAALAQAATEQLGASPDECEYLLCSPKVPHPSGVFLKVIHDSRSALVGPMAGPTLPATLMPDRGCSLPDLLQRVGLGIECDATRTYPVIVTYSGVFRDAAIPPRRKPRESDLRYGERCAAAEGIRLERTCHEGVQVVRYDRAPATWGMEDLEYLLALAYQCLPTREPRWRESGAIVQEPFGIGDGARVPAVRYCMQIERGDYAAYLRLPAFPLHALAERLATRPCEILLGQPVVKTETLAKQIRHTATTGGAR